MQNTHRRLEELVGASHANADEAHSSTVKRLREVIDVTGAERDSYAASQAQLIEQVALLRRTQASERRRSAEPPEEVITQLGAVRSELRGALAQLASSQKQTPRRK